MTGESGKPDDAPARDCRRMRWWKKLTYSLFIAVSFFVLLEGVLALVGVQPAIDTTDPFVGFAGSSPLFVPDPKNPRQMVTAPNKLAYFNKQSFPRRKPEGVVRIFCLGGSTTYGRPYDDATSFAGWLRELLPRVGPQATYEVINAGGVSYASYRLVRVAEEIEQYKPDVLIVYTGQNEFLEERTYRDIRRTSSLRRRVTAGLSHTRTFALAQSLIGRQPSGTKDDRYQMPEEVDAKLDHTVGPTSYERNAERRRSILQHLSANLARIMQITRRARTDIVFVTPASNLKDCSPFKSLHSEGLSTRKLELWNELYSQAEQLEREGQRKAALAAYHRAAEIDSRFAELHWKMGRLLLKLKRLDDAQVAFRRSVDEDVCPLRAVGEIPQIMRTTADRLNVPLVDFEQLIEKQCRQQLGHASAGDEFFLDHVHPTIATNGLLAEAIVERLIETGTIESQSKLTDEMMQAVSKQIESRIDDHQHAVALRNLAKVLNWAGKHREAGSLALQAVRQLPEDPECLLMSAAYLAQTGRNEQAIAHFRRALRFKPDYVAAHQMLGAALVDEGKLNEALGHFTELARLSPDDAQAWQMIGAIHAEQRRFDEAFPNYRKAVSLKPDDADIHYNLGIALGHLGRHQEAIRHYRRAVGLSPNDADARNNLGVMLLREGRADEAADHFSHVVRLRPDDKTAAANLREAEKRKQPKKNTRNE